VSPRLRIPPDTFPTIQNAKYLSFKYYLEVIVDLNPKTSVFQSSSTPIDYVPEDVKATPSNFLDTMVLLKKEKPFMLSYQFDIVIGTIDSAARDLESQLQRQEQLLHHYPSSSQARRVPMGTFPSAPDLTRQRDSVLSSASSFARHPPPPPPFTRGLSTPGGITLAGGPPPRSRSASSRTSISKSILAEREQALLASAPDTPDPNQEASAPPISIDDEDTIDNPIIPEAPQIRISRSHENLPGLRIEIPEDTQPATGDDDERYLASLQSRVSAPMPSNRPNPAHSIRRRPVSRELETEEASAPPLDDSTEDSVSVSDRVSVASTLPIYTE
jgi:hypothetical protein